MTSTGPLQPQPPALLPPCHTPAREELQRRVPPALLGRVSSLDFFVSTAFLPLSMALAGPVSELIGLTATFSSPGSPRSCSPREPCWPPGCRPTSSPTRWTGGRPSRSARRPEPASVDARQGTG